MYCIVFHCSYSFHNDLPLTSATDGFVKKISEIVINDGGDGPESQGDALAQVIECEKQVGWRNNTRRVVLLATDIYFHVAGHGVSGCSMISCVTENAIDEFSVAV